MQRKFQLSRLAASVGHMLHTSLFAYMYRTGMVACDRDPTVPDLPEAVQKSLDKIADQVKAIGEKAMAEAKKHGDVTTATKEKVDELLVEHGGLVQKMKDTQQELVKLRDIQKSQPSQVKTLGELFAESDGFKAYAKGDRGTNLSIELPRKAVSSSLASAGDAVAPDFRPAILPMPTRRFTIRDLMMPGQTNSNAVTYVKETGFTNNAAPVAETTQKPESNIDFQLFNAPVRTIAHWVIASKQILDDAPQLQSYIDGRLRFGLAIVEENQLLAGDGTGQNLEGLIPQATAYNRPESQTKIDVIRRSMTQVRLAEYRADGVIINPEDWEEIELTKTDQGAYVWANPASLLSPTIWGLPVVDTVAIAAGNFLTGAFKLSATVWDREDANVQVSTEDRDNFIKNMVTIRAEERLALTVFRPEALIYGNFATAISN